MGAATSLATLGLSAVLGQQKKARSNELIEADRVRTAQELKLQQLIERRKREQQLAKALASTRARAGSSGIGAFGSAADAIASGLSRLARTEQAQSDAQVRLSLQGNDTRAALRQRNNLLDQQGSLLSQGVRTLGSIAGSSLLD
ncbi:MAG TPA: hypothetical protein VHL31_01395 [Geminicoccus sp.]|jgi:acetyl-CoA acetyltransferase|uniref:hypothetical protein n=1 Tax=Geminicoccus sp. TaxID=2024832 RepID=UPI002E31318A|nr:hypothetical protein [Geminicoccus sp.]HEX2524940.1 hypothetical protein [Geminicoccus sp.]